MYLVEIIFITTALNLVKYDKYVGDRLIKLFVHYLSQQVGQSVRQSVNYNLVYVQSSSKLVKRLSKLLLKFIY